MVVAWLSHVLLVVSRSHNILLKRNTSNRWSYEVSLKSVSDGGWERLLLSCGGKRLGVDLVLNSWSMMKLVVGKVGLLGGWIGKGMLNLLWRYQLLSHRLIRGLRNYGLPLSWLALHIILIRIKSWSSSIELLIRCSSLSLLVRVSVLGRISHCLLSKLAKNVRRELLQNHQ